MPFRGALKRVPFVGVRHIASATSYFSTVTQGKQTNLRCGRFKFSALQQSRTQHTIIIYFKSFMLVDGFSERLSIRFVSRVLIVIDFMRGRY